MNEARYRKDRRLDNLRRQAQFYQDEEEKKMLKQHIKEIQLQEAHERMYSSIYFKNKKPGANGFGGTSYFKKGRI